MTAFEWTLLFVDDHPIYRDGVQRALSTRLEGLTIVAVGGFAAALAALSEVPDVDLCLSDQRLGDGEGVDLVAAVRRGHPTVAAGVISADVTPALARRARAAGAVACLSKDRDADGLVDALITLFEGGTVFDDAPPALRDDGFTLKRREILALAAEGLLDKQISERLGVTESAVRNHWQHLFQRLEAANRTEAVTRAIRRGLI